MYTELVHVPSRRKRLSFSSLADARSRARDDRNEKLVSRALASIFRPAAQKYLRELHALLTK